MKNKARIIIFPPWASLFALCFFSCASLVDKAGAVLDGSMFSQKTISVWTTESAAKKSSIERNNSSVRVSVVNGKQSGEMIVIAPQKFPNLFFYGIFVAPNDDSSIERRFELTHYTYFSSYAHGWNEFSMDLSGAGIFAETHMRFIDGIEPVNISAGKIRNGENRLTGEQALTALKNRKERLAALAEWMHEQKDVPVFESQKSFADYWKPILLAELVPKKTRKTAFNSPESAAWQKGNAEWVFAESVFWNKTYTAQIFPEYLHALRNSGALLRDWDESISWLYLEYSWDEILKPLTQGVTLVKEK